MNFRQVGHLQYLCGCYAFNLGYWNGQGYVEPLLQVHWLVYVVAFALDRIVMTPRSCFVCAAVGVHLHAQGRWLDEKIYRQNVSPLSCISNIDLL